MVFLAQLAEGAWGSMPLPNANPFHSTVSTPSSRVMSPPLHPLPIKTNEMYRGGTLKLLLSPEIDSASLCILAGTKTLFLLCSYSPHRLSKIPAQYCMYSNVLLVLKSIGLSPKGVGPSPTLAWPGWKQPDIPVEVDTGRLETDVGRQEF